MTDWKTAAANAIREALWEMERGHYDTAEEILNKIVEELEL